MLCSPRLDRIIGPSPSRSPPPFFTSTSPFYVLRCSSGSFNLKYLQPFNLIHSLAHPHVIRDYHWSDLPLDCLLWTLCLLRCNILPPEIISLQSDPTLIPSAEYQLRDLFSWRTLLSPSVWVLSSHQIIVVPLLSGIHFKLLGLIMFSVPSRCLCIAIEARSLHQPFLHFPSEYIFSVTSSSDVPSSLFFVCIV